jgi:hypothetical protein
MGRVWPAAAASKGVVSDTAGSLSFVRASLLQTGQKGRRAINHWSMQTTWNSAASKNKRHIYLVSVKPNPDVQLRQPTKNPW